MHQYGLLSKQAALTMTNDSSLAHYSRIIEAVIFASAHPVSTQALEQYIPEGITIREVLTDIAERYGEQSGIELTRIDQNWAFRTKAELASYLNLEKDVQRPLSRAALETLAIIAYHQPVTRAEIEEIRGVSISRGTIDILLEQEWIKPKGRRHTPGRPLTWGTSDVFLDHFGLEDLTALPGLEELKHAGLLRPSQRLSDEEQLGQLFTSAEEDEDISQHREYGDEDYNEEGDA